MRMAGIRIPANPLLATASATAVIAAACAGWFGWSWYSAANSSPLSNSAARDAALQDGEQAIQNLNTFDYHHASQDLNIWLASATGNLRAGMAQGRATFLQEVKQIKADTAARILDGALTALDTHAGTATIMAAIQLTVYQPPNQPTVELCSVEATLARTSSGWEPSAMTRPSCGITASGTSPAPSASPTPAATGAPTGGATPAASPARSTSPTSSASPSPSATPSARPSSSRSG
jgi:Mce-associated membrane protein